jgi:uncharacterized integral membrane protein
VEKRPEKRRMDRRQIAIVGLAALGGVFAALNLDDVDVNWVFGTWSTPLILVIAISMLIGAGLGYLATRRRRG